MEAQTSGSRSTRRRWGTAVLVILAALSGALVIDATRRAMAKDLVPWQSDVQAALAEAGRQDRLVLLYFTADWCGPCHMMRADAYSQPEVAQAITEHVTPVKVDLTQMEPGSQAVALAQRFSVLGPPSLVLVDPLRGEVGRLDGYQPAEALLDWIARVR